MQHTFHSSILFEDSRNQIQNLSTIQYVQSYLNYERNPFSRKNKSRLTYFDLFCGGGGLSLGVHYALSCFGLDARLLCAIDSDKAALKLVTKHFNPIVKRSTPVEDLIKYAIDLSGEQSDFVTSPIIVDQQISQFKGKVDLLVGGPPCQGHSNLNNKTRGYDPRNLLYYIMPAFAVALDIPCLIIENVRSIQNASEKVVEITKKILTHHGYYVCDIVLDAIDFGVAQTRNRHFLIASKIKPPTIKESIESVKVDTITFDQINTNMPKLSGCPDFFEKSSVLSEENQKRIDHLHKTGCYELKNELRPVCHQGGHNYPDVYGRIRGDRPAGTITTGFGSPGRGRFIHPHEPRMITIREAARLQSFPDWYFKDIDDLNLVRSNLYKIIGDAVPSLLVFPLIASILNSFEDKLIS